MIWPRPRIDKNWLNSQFIKSTNSIGPLSLFSWPGANSPEIYRNIIYSFGVDINQGLKTTRSMIATTEFYWANRWLVSYSKGGYIDRTPTGWGLVWFVNLQTSFSWDTGSFHGLMKQLKSNQLHDLHGDPSMSYDLFWLGRHCKTSFWQYS